MDTLMSGGVFVLKEGGELIELTEAPYDSEAILQELLASHSNLLAGSQIDSDSPRRWLLVSREAGLPSETDRGNRWSVDHLFLDQDGIPTIVEVKRSQDSRIRREVIGQMLDYAANAVVYWPIETIRGMFARQCESDRVDPEDRLVQFLNPTQSTDEFWQTVKINLQAGKIRLVFVADRIPLELARVVEFLNTQMDPAEVLAIEIRQFAGQGLKTLVPRVVGKTAESEQRKSIGPRETRQWEEPTFFAELEARRGKEEAAVAMKMLDWARSRTRIWWGRGKKLGSFFPMFDFNGVSIQLFGVWTSGTVELQFQWYLNQAPFDSPDRRSELLNRLNMIKDINLPVDSIARRPSFPLGVLVDPRSLEQFLLVFEWFTDEVKSFST